MFAFIRFLLWTGSCIAMGVFFATYDVGGRTPLEHAERAWKQHGPSVDEVKSGAGGLVDDAKKKLLKEQDKRDKPVEHHSSEERDAVNKLIARHGQAGLH